MKQILLLFAFIMSCFIVLLTILLMANIVCNPCDPINRCFLMTLGSVGWGIVSIIIWKKLEK